MQLDLITKLDTFSFISGIKISSHLHNYLILLWKSHANVITHEKRKAPLFAGDAIDNPRKSKGIRFKKKSWRYKNKLIMRKKKSIGSLYNQS